MQITRDIVDPIIINIKHFSTVTLSVKLNAVSPRQVLQWRPISMLTNMRKIVIHIQIHCSLVVLIRLVVVRSPYNAQVQPRELHLGLRKSVTFIYYSVLHRQYHSIHAAYSFIYYWRYETINEANDASLIRPFLLYACKLQIIWDHTEQLFELLVIIFIK